MVGLEAVGIDVDKVLSHMSVDPFSMFSNAASMWQILTMKLSLLQCFWFSVMASVYLCLMRQEPATGLFCG